MAFVSTDCHQVCFELMDGGDGLLAEPLHRIGMEQDSAITAEASHGSAGLEGARFIISCHDRNQLGIRSNE